MPDDDEGTVKPGLQPGQTDVIAVHTSLTGELTAGKPGLQPGQPSPNAEGEQDDAAAERSTPIPSRSDTVSASAGDEVDTRTAYWVQVIDAEGQVLRVWQTKFETQADTVGLSLRIVPVL
jgi:hypothetical protein